jgi:hypothetical protein
MNRTVMKTFQTAHISTGDVAKIKKFSEEIFTKVREHRPAQRQARQAKGKRENRYVIKVMRLNRKGYTKARLPQACCNTYPYTSVGTHL